MLEDPVVTAEQLADYAMQFYGNDSAAAHDWLCMVQRMYPMTTVEREKLVAWLDAGPAGIRYRNVEGYQYKSECELSKVIDDAIRAADGDWCVAGARLRAMLKHLPLNVRDRMRLQGALAYGVEGLMHLFSEVRDQHAGPPVETGRAAVGNVASGRQPEVDRDIQW